MSDMALASNVRALLSGFTQDTRLIRLTTPLGVDLLAECVQGEEGIGQDYSLKIDAGARTLAWSSPPMLHGPVKLSSRRAWRSLRGL